MADEKIANIKRLKITCKNCGTQVIADIGKNIQNCPCCYTKFIQQSDNNPYQILAEAFFALSQNQTADFSLIVDTKEQQ